MAKFTYTALAAKQADQHLVLTFAAKPEEVLAYASIDRAGRDAEGHLQGFQRHQIAAHIKEIRDYLARPDAILPNPIVLAFIEGVKATHKGNGVYELEIDVEEDKPGFVVDGQQRLTALSGILDKDFQVFVSAIICNDYNELRQQFVLINSTRPLPKALIYELLPTVNGLPEKFTARSFAARLTERLNYDEDSSLHTLIYQHTNPTGFIRDTAIQKIIMSSVSDGAMRELTEEPDHFDQSFLLVSEFFRAVQETFPSEWIGHKPKTSRLVHGAGIMAMGYVMEFLYSRYGAMNRKAFMKGLQPLKDRTAWTSGQWHLSDTDNREWNKIQNVPQDISSLANYLLKVLKQAQRGD